MHSSKCRELIRSEINRSIKVKAAVVGIGGLATILVVTMVGMSFFENTANMTNGVFIQGVILVLNSAIVTGIALAAAKWVYRAF